MLATTREQMAAASGHNTWCNGAHDDALIMSLMRCKVVHSTVCALHGRGALPLVSAWHCSTEMSPLPVMNDGSQGVAFQETRPNQRAITLAVRTMVTLHQHCPL
jgi:hypothetical protein